MGDRDRFRGRERERSDSRNRNYGRGGGGDGRDYRDSGRGGGGDYRGGGGDMRDNYRGGGGGGEVRDDRRNPVQPHSSAAPTERDRDQVLTTSLLVRNVSYRVRPDELKRIFSRYGDVRDVYIPEDYYTKRARGFAFVEFYDGRDAADASHHLERYIVDGREISIVFAKDRRKTSDEMRTGTAGSRSGGGRGDSYDRSAGRDRGDGGGDNTRPLPRRNSRDASASRSRSRDRRGARDDPPSDKRSKSISPEPIDRSGGDDPRSRSISPA